MRLDLKGRTAKVFNQIFIGGVGDVARWACTVQWWRIWLADWMCTHTQFLPTDNPIL